MGMGFKPSRRTLRGLYLYKTLIQNFEDIFTVQHLKTMFWV